MPIRIYDIAKKYSITAKEVIDLAKSNDELKQYLANKNLTPSSSLDKITANYLEDYLEKIKGITATSSPITGDQPTPNSGTPIKTINGDSLDNSGTSVGTIESPNTTAVEEPPQLGVGITEQQKQNQTDDKAIAVTITNDIKNTGDVITEQPTTTTNVVEGPKVIEATQQESTTETISNSTIENISEIDLVKKEDSQLTPGLVGETQPTFADVAGNGDSHNVLNITPVTTQDKEQPLKEPAISPTSGATATAEIVEDQSVKTDTGTETVLEQQKQPASDTALQTELTKTEESTPVKSPESATANAISSQTTSSEPPKPSIGEKVGSIDLSKFNKPKEKQKNQKPIQQQQKKPQQLIQTKGEYVKQQGGKPQLQQKPHPQQPGKTQTLVQQPPKKDLTKPLHPQNQSQAVKFKDKSKPTPTIPKTPVLPPNAPQVMIKPPILVRDLAQALNKKPFQVIAELLKRRVMAKVNDIIDEKISEEVAATFGIKLVIEKRGTRPQPQKPDQIKPKETDDESKLKPRPPVVTIMGHVDHGKTTLLDAIRKSNVVATEAGGITQHIGAYTISFPHPYDKKKLQEITFLDTPGHAAFSAMRARGANVTDIVILVVAADDGVMPQTIEALNHAKEAKVPIIVAVNKCDHPNANPSRVRDQLSKQGLTPEEWGGDTVFVDISALKKQGVDQLLEFILLKADELNLRANPDCPAWGNVIESGLEPGGPTATLLVRRGTLKVGDFIVSGQFYGKVRALINDRNERLKEAKPSYAVKVLGLNGAPEPGSEFEAVKDIDTAREIAEKRIEELNQQGQIVAAKKITLESLLESIEASKNKVLKVVLKADTQGSVEAISAALKDIKSDKVSLEIIHSGVGAISESDVMLASAAKGVIIGFHTRLEHGVSDIAKKEGVQIKLYSIIYELIDEVKKAMAGLLEPIITEVVIGEASVKKVFELSKGGKVAGCMVTDGTITRGAKAKVLRGKNLIYDGIIGSLRHFQDEVNEVRVGMECGIRIDGFNDFKEGDVIQCYNLEKKLQSI
jgi:translation initiation factor IF-2